MLLREFRNLLGFGIAESLTSSGPSLDTKDRPSACHAMSHVSRDCHGTLA